MSKYCLVVNGRSYYCPFDHLGLELTSDTSLLVSDPDSVGLVVFTGGEDVSPHLYGHKNVASYNSKDRDASEVAVFYNAYLNQIPMAGICRGAQFLCVMAGGHLVQDISNHGNNHYLRYVDRDGVEKTSPEKVTSTHHQMQYPWPIGEDKFEVLAWSSSAISNYYLYDGVRIPTTVALKELTMEPDVIFYKNINALVMQYHPEWMPRNSWGFKYAQNMVTEKLGHLIDNRITASA